MTRAQASSTATRPRLAPASGLALWAGLLVLYLAWGSTYLAIRYALESFPPYLLVATRFLVAGGILLIWNAGTGALRRAWPTRREWRDSAIVGGLLVAGGMGLVAYAEQALPSGITALLAALIPAWATVLGRLVYRERVQWLVGIGIVVGFGGVAILVGPSLLAGGGGAGGAGGGAGGSGAAAFDPVSSALMVVSPILWAAGSVYAAHGARLPSVATLASATQMLTGAAIAFVIAVLIGDVGRFDPTALTVPAVAALVYLATVGGVLAFATYVWLLRVAPLPKVTTYAYVNPVLAFVLGGLLASEPVTPVTAIAGLVIVVGVGLIVTGRGRRAATTAERPGGLSSER